MILQLIYPTETLATPRTTEGSFSGVNTLVSLHGLQVTETLVTLFTQERFFSSMYTLVGLQAT